MEEVKRYTTAAVLDFLQRRLGLPALEKQIANDTADRFLPPRLTGRVRDGRGRTGLWEPWMVRRAERLYRLRQRKDAAGQPFVYGDTLRLLLFVHDGWGWSAEFRNCVFAVLKKSIAATLATRSPPCPRP